MEIHPEAKYYYELESSTLVFKFPTPERLDGIASTTRSVSNSFSYLSVSLFVYPPLKFLGLHGCPCLFRFSTLRYPFLSLSLSVSLCLSLSLPLSLSLSHYLSLFLFLYLFLFLSIYLSVNLYLFHSGHEDGQYHIYISRGHEADIEQYQVNLDSSLLSSLPLSCIPSILPFSDFFLLYSLSALS